jgi:hypothetical protein
MHIRRLHKNVFDVFLGNGFTNWTRVKRAHFGVIVVAGNRLQRNTMREIANTLERY